jgi:hypothetical protein
MMWLFTGLFIHSPKEEAMERTAAILLVTFFLFSNQRSPIEKRILSFIEELIEKATSTSAQNLVFKSSQFSTFFVSPEVSHPDPIYVVQTTDGYMHENVE